MAVPDLAARMRFFFERTGLSQAELATKLDITDGAVSHWLSDRSSPTQANLLQFVEACGIDMATFYGPLKQRRRA